MKKQIWIGLACLSMAMLTACYNNSAEEIGPHASEAEPFEATDAQSEPATYRINKTSLGDNTVSENENMSPDSNGTGSEYEISDMLPRPSDDTLIMSVEEAEAFMNKNANDDTGSENIDFDDVQ